MKECCKNCKHLCDIYFPPIDEHPMLMRDGCLLMAGEGQVMYLDDLEGKCECYERRRDENIR